MDYLLLTLAGLIGYIMGAIPFGFLFVKATKGVDLRDVGSGRTGGTNSFRAAGMGVGFFTYIMDIVKGALAVLIVRAIIGNLLTTELLPWAEALAGVFAVVGHNWSIFLKFGGGAGTGPNVGWATAIWWPIFFITFVLGGLTLYGIGMASVASLVVAATIPITFAIRYFAGLDPTPAYLLGGLVTAAIVTWSLRPNIKRIIEGNERLVGPRARKQNKEE